MDSSAVDAPDDVIEDSSACPSGEYLVYVAPGCGNDAHPVCRGPGDACIVTVCNCDGTQGVRCDQSVQPYLHDGPCADADTSDADLSDALPSDASHGDAGTDGALGDAAADSD